MKRAAKKAFILFGTLVTLLCFSMAVRADWVTEVVFTNNLKVPLGPSYLMPLKSLKGATNLKVTCDKDVYVAVEKQKGEAYPYFRIASRVKKGYPFIHSTVSGTAVVSGKLKGKNKTVKIKFSLLKTTYKCPFKSIVIGSKNLTNKFKKSNMSFLDKEYDGFNYVYLDPDEEQIDYEKSTYTLSPGWQKLVGKTIRIKPASGWKVLSIRQMLSNSVTDPESPEKSYWFVMIKNGRKLKVPGVNQSTSLRILMKNKKTGMFQEVFLG